MSTTARRATWALPRGSRPKTSARRSPRPRAGGSFAQTVRRNGADRHDRAPLGQAPPAKPGLRPGHGPRPTRCALRPAGLRWLCKHELADGRLKIVLDKDCLLEAGQKLEVVVQSKRYSKSG